MTNLRKALNEIDKRSTNQVERGKAFEDMIKVYLEHDDVQKQYYSKVWHYEDWAKLFPEHSSTDIGIDLVASLSNENGFCAIQCKYYASGSEISKKDLDSFIAASSADIFVRRVLIDTSEKSLGRNAQSVIDQLENFIRPPISDLDNSRIDWLSWIDVRSVKLKKKSEPRPHQKEAVDAIISGFEGNDRGNIVMACGTGKTFTSLILAEKMLSGNCKVLYLVPSLALLSQTLQAWKQDATVDFMAFSVCSDKNIGHKTKSPDFTRLGSSDLAFPSTTNALDLFDEIKEVSEKDKMIVVFSTYHSIEVVSKAQKNHGMSAFDLIICDEAHRTTGVTLSQDDESNFVKVHDNEFINGKKTTVHDCYSQDLHCKGTSSS